MPPVEPMLAVSRPELPPEGALPGGIVAEQKFDGYRAVLFARRDRILIQSRQGTDLTPAFPDVAAAAADLRDKGLVLDGELVVLAEGRIDFGALQSRARRRGRGAAGAAAIQPAHVIVFDVLEADGRELLGRPYRDRRALLEESAASGVLAAPFVLCPSTRDRATMREWLDPVWGDVGVEGVVLKGLEQTYLLGRRAWIKVRSRVTSEAVIGGVTGSVAHPSTLLLGRYDENARLRLVARSTPLSSAIRHELGHRLSAAGTDHPWHGRRFSSGWGTRGDLDFTTVRPDVVAEFVADSAVDAGRYRHPVRFVRTRDDVDPRQTPPFGG